MYSQRDIPKMKISRREVEYESKSDVTQKTESSTSRGAREKDRGGKELTYDFQIQNLQSKELDYDPLTTQVRHEVHQVHHDFSPDASTVQLKQELDVARSTITRLEKEINEMRGKYTTQIS